MTNWRRLERKDVVRHHNEITRTYQNGGLKYTESESDNSTLVSKYYETVLHLRGGSRMPGGVKYNAFLFQKEGGGMVTFKLYSNNNMPLTVEGSSNPSLTREKAAHVRKSTGNRHKSIAKAQLPENANEAMRKFWDKISGWLGNIV